MQLCEIACFTDDVDGTVQFHQALLDRAPIMHQPGEIAIFQVGGVKLLIHKTYEPGEDHLPPDDHVAFLVEDLDAEFERLRAAGLEVEHPPKDYSWGRSAYLRDPSGKLWELSQ